MLKQLPQNYKQVTGGTCLFIFNLTGCIDGIFNHYDILTLNRTSFNTTLNGVGWGGGERSEHS